MIKKYEPHDKKHNHCVYRRALGLVSLNSHFCQAIKLSGGWANNSPSKMCSGRCPDRLALPSDSQVSALTPNVGVSKVSKVIFVLLMNSEVTRPNKNVRLC